MDSDGDGGVSLKELAAWMAQVEEEEASEHADRTWLMHEQHSFDEDK